MKRAVIFLIAGPALATAILAQLLLPAAGAFEGEHFKVSMRPLHISVVRSRDS
jgi:hypothetical protein